MRIELRELSTDWLPWRFQIVQWDDGRKFGRSEPGEIVCSTSNFETREAAENALRLLTKLKGTPR